MCCVKTQKQNFSALLCFFRREKLLRKLAAYKKFEVYLMRVIEGLPSSKYTAVQLLYGFLLFVDLLLVLLALNFLVLNAHFLFLDKDFFISFRI